MYRDGVFFFFGLLLLAVAGFWPTYLVPRFEADWHVHLHGVAMFAWCVLLIAQAGLIRARQGRLHRSLGKVSFGLVPVIVVSTLLLAHYRLQQAINEELLYFLYVQLSLLGVFVLAFSLAMANRGTPALHARFIVCTALTLIDPIVARILYAHLGFDRPLLQVMTYALVETILLLLILADLKAGRGAKVYAAMLVVFVATQVPTFFLPQLPQWRSFAQAYAALPLP